jgi:hypothetical protein
MRYFKEHVEEVAKNDPYIQQKLEKLPYARDSYGPSKT